MWSPVVVDGQADVREFRQIGHEETFVLGDLRVLSFYRRGPTATRVGALSWIAALLTGTQSS